MLSERSATFRGTLGEMQRHLKDHTSLDVSKMLLVLPQTPQLKVSWTFHHIVLNAPFFEEEIHLF